MISRPGLITGSFGRDGSVATPGAGGRARATALLDMTKCFEQVRLWHVWRWGCHWGFPRALLRIILLVFSFQRRVGLRSSVSQPVTTYAATIAGSVFFCAILHMLFIWPCDCLMSKWARLRLTKYVDDLTISYRGMNHTVATVITEAVSSMAGCRTGWTSTYRKMRKAWRASRWSWSRTPRSKLH